MGGREHNQIADVDGGFLANVRSSVFEHIERGLLKNPEQPAVICMHQPRDHFVQYLGSNTEADGFKSEFAGRSEREDCLKLTYTQLHVAGLKLAKGLVEFGIQPGARLLCMVQNGCEYASLVWTGIIARLTHSAVDPAMLEPGKRNDLQSYLEILKPTVVVVPSARHIQAVERAVSQSGTTIQLGVFLDHDDKIPIPNHWKSLREIMARCVRREASDDEVLLKKAKCDDADRIHSILFTSGTSAGRPKGCPLTVASQTHALESQSWLINKNNSTRVLQQAHNSKSIGMLHTLLTWQAGGALVMPTGSSFSLSHTVDAILDHRVTFVVLTPALVHNIEQSFSSRGAKVGDWDHVRTIQVGGDAVTKEVLMKCSALFPKAEVLVNHGMSEGAGLFIWPFHDWPINLVPFFAGTISPVGVVARGARVLIWDSKRGAAAARGQPGEILVSSPSLIAQYIGGEKNDNEVFFQDKRGRRWMNTGDTALMDTDGLVYIFGRSKHAIHRAGFAIMPAVVESCIEKFTGSQVSYEKRSRGQLGYKSNRICTRPALSPSPTQSMGMSRSRSFAAWRDLRQMRSHGMSIDVWEKNTHSPASHRSHRLD